MGSSQSIISKEDMEAYKQLTYFTEAEIKNCLQKFSELLDPSTPLKNVHDPQANVKWQNPSKKILYYSGQSFACKRSQRTARVEGFFCQFYLKFPSAYFGRKFVMSDFQVNPFATRICQVFYFPVK